MGGVYVLHIGRCLTDDRLHVLVVRCSAVVLARTCLVVKALAGGSLPTHSFTSAAGTHCVEYSHRCLKLKV